MRHTMKKINSEDMEKLQVLQKMDSPLIHAYTSEFINSDIEFKDMLFNLIIACAKQIEGLQNYIEVDRIANPTDTHHYIAPNLADFYKKQSKDIK